MTASSASNDFASEFPDLVESFRGQFHVERELGRGGMGVVLLARDERLERLVAIKVLPPALAATPETRERFLREARTAARLSHPNIVPVYRADEAGGVAYFAMAYIDGESLADRVRDRGPLLPTEAVPILRDVAQALAYAHARGVVHRDIKPENILLERSTGRTLVTDFGIAHQPTTDPSARLTEDGHVLGTLHFMSPEQVNGDLLDGRSDLYALGVVAYFVLSGRLPFQGLGGAAVLVAHATKPAPPLRTVAPAVPAALATVIDRCLAKSPVDRFPSGEELAEALDAAMTVSAESSSVAPLARGLPARIGESEAAAVWQRAAQLQADALRRTEVTGAAAREIGAGGGRPVGDESVDAERGYRVTDVAAAAEEAGISRQYVALALAELPRGVGSPGTELEFAL